MLVHSWREVRFAALIKPGIFLLEICAIMLENGTATQGYDADAVTVEPDDTSSPGLRQGGEAAPPPSERAPLSRPRRGRRGGGGGGSYIDRSGGRGGGAARWGPPWWGSHELPPHAPGGSEGKKGEGLRGRRWGFAVLVRRIQRCPPCPLGSGEGESERGGRRQRRVAGVGCELARRARAVASFLGVGLPRGLGRVRCSSVVKTRRLEQ